MLLERHFSPFAAYTNNHRVKHLQCLRTNHHQNVTHRFEEHTTPYTPYLLFPRPCAPSFTAHISTCLPAIRPFISPLQRIVRPLDDPNSPPHHGAGIYNRTRERDAGISSKRETASSQTHHILQTYSHVESALRPQHSGYTPSQIKFALRKTPTPPNTPHTYTPPFNPYHTPTHTPCHPLSLTTHTHTHTH